MNDHNTINHQEKLVEHIKRCYHAYRHTQDIDRKGLFFSPSCMQICRTTPSYSATSREEIVQYLKDAQKGDIPLEQDLNESENVEDSSQTVSNVKVSLGVYTIRPLRASECDFGDGAVTSPVHLTPNELKARATEQNWVGMRVDLWDEGVGQGLLVKVQYWWRLETIPDDERLKSDTSDKNWRQCLHDIMYIGPRDGTEGAGGLQILQ